MPVFFSVVFFVLTFFIVQPLNAQDSNHLKWEKVQANIGEVAEIAISSSNPDVVYAGLENNAHALYKSMNGGKSWKRISGPGDHTKDIAVSPKDPDKVYVAMSESVHTTDLTIKPTKKSRFDSGYQPADKETQTVLSTGISPGPAEHSFSSFEIFEADDRVMYAALRGGSHGINGAVLGKLYKTEDQGVTWKEVETSLPQINVLAIHPQNSKIIYIGSRDGVYQSEDSGTNLKKVLNIQDVVSLEVTKNSPNLVLAASAKQVAFSEDEDETWKNITGTLSEIRRVRFSADPKIFYAATFNGLFKSDDYGKSWKDITANINTKNFQIITPHPINVDIAFAGTSSLWSSVRSADRYRTSLLANQGIYKTEDGGKSWQRSDMGIFDYNFEEVATSPTKPYEAWFSGVASMGGLKTEDGGQSWRLSQLPTLHYPMRIKYSYSNPNKIYATSWHTGGPFAITADGGVNWELVNQSAFFAGVERGKELYGKATGGERGTIHIHGLAVDPNDDNIVYAGSVEDANNPDSFPLRGAHIFKSEDGGKSWKETDSGFPHDKPTAIHDLKIDTNNAKIIYASTTMDEAKVGLGIYKSEDAGLNWKAINNGLGNLNVPTLIINPKDSNILVASTDGGIYRSINAGGTWRQTNPVSSFDVEFVIDQPNILYASTNNGVLKSTDFGLTWVEENDGLPKGEGQGIGVDKTGGVIYAAVNWQGLYVARLKDIPKKDLSSEFGKGHGFGMMEHFGMGSGFSQQGESPFWVIGLVGLGMVVVVGVTAAVIWRTRHNRLENDDFDV